jgi:hypothetical protein
MVALALPAGKYALFAPHTVLVSAPPRYSEIGQANRADLGR